ncbi:hypothetical protein, partial [Actinomyces sp. MRS3W]|uniref:hypothetical protein n=1 Tax=Actinomyces sp. MRS3W TaxID=2800796 RepID=UPI0028FD3413
MRSLRLLIISPAFHGYWRAYEESFKHLGHSVRTLRYDELTTALAKARHKLRVELADRTGGDGQERWAREVTARCAAAVRSARPDRVLIIRGDLLREEFWDAVATVGARPVTLIYDEIERMATSLPELAQHGPVASYSARDTALLTAHGIRALHVPDAYDARLPFTPVPSPEVVFIGALYGQRGPLVQALYDAGVPVRAYGRDWSHHLFDRIRTWNAPRPRVPAERD